MKHLRLAFAFLTVAAILFSYFTDVDAQKKKKGKKGKAVIGEVVKCEVNEGTGTLVIKTGAKKKKGKVVSEGKEMTFKITAETKVVLLGKKRKDQPTAAAMSDVTTGKRVRVVVSADNAETASAIQIFQGGKKKKKGAG